MKRTPPVLTGLLPYLALAAAGFLLYSNTLGASFHLDDAGAILDNLSIRDISNLKAIWGAFNTRFIVGLSLALNYYWGQQNVLGYHLFNLSAHLLASFLVYRFSLLLFESPALSDSALRSHKKAVSLFSAFIFLTHPLQTQAVDYIWQRAALLAAVFYLLTLVLYAKARTGRSTRFYLASLACCFVGMFSKETMITSPLAVLLYEACFCGTLGENRLKRFYRVLPFLCLLPVIPLTLLRAPRTMELMQAFSITRFVGEDVMPRGLYVLTQINVLRTYLRLLFFPAAQNLDYDYPVASSLFNAPTFFSLLLLAAVLFFGIRAFPKHRPAAFGIFWFFLTLSVESFVPQSDVIFEHRLYLPMAGFGLFAAYWIFFFLAARGARELTAVLLMVVGTYGFLTYRRNFVWKDELTLWSDVIQKSPNKPRAYNNRGNAYQAMGLLDRALSDYDKAIELKPDLAKTYANRGAVYRAQGLLDQALGEFDKAIRIDPRAAEAYNNRGVVRQAKGLLDEAIADFDEAARIKPDVAEVYFNRGMAYQTKGLFEQAVMDYTQAIRRKPDYAKAYSNRTMAYYRLGQYDKSLEDLSRVQALGVKVDPEFLAKLKKDSGQAA